MSDFFTRLQGSRTFLAAAASIATAVAGVTGILPSVSAQGVTAGLIALAIVFQRLATKRDSETIASVRQDLADAAAAIDTIHQAVAPKATPAESPATIPFVNP